MAPDRREQPLPLYEQLIKYALAGEIAKAIDIYTGDPTVVLDLVRCGKRADMFIVYTFMTQSDSPLCERIGNAICGATRNIQTVRYLSIVGKLLPFSIQTRLHHILLI